MQTLVIEGYLAADPSILLAQGSGRKDGKISTWDILHPGRDRQGVMPENPDEIRANVIQEIEGFLSQRI